MSVSGIVQEIKTRDVAGGKKAYNVVVGGQSYGAGLFAPKCKEGDYVTFETEERNGFINIAPRSLKVGKVPSEAVAKAAAQTTGGSFDKRQDAISRQAASNTAIAFMQLLASQDALPVPASKSKGDKQAALEALLQGYEQRFYEHNTGNKWVNIAPQEERTAASAQVVQDDIVDADPWA